MTRRLLALLAPTFVLMACSDSAPSEAPAGASSSELRSTAVTFARGAGAVDIGREVCDERRDPSAQNTTRIAMVGLYPSDVVATLAPSPTAGPELTLRIKGTSDVLTTRFFATRGEDCWAGVKEIGWANGKVWRSTLSVPRPPAGSCAGRCGRSGSDRCYCDDRCTDKGDCCVDYQPLCKGDGYGEAGSPLDLVFDRTRTQPHFTGEDWSGTAVRYDFHRLVDAHPECVERTSDGGSLARIYMDTKLGAGPTVTQVVSGYGTSPAQPVALNREVALTVRGVDLKLAFRCGPAPAHAAAFDDNGGAGYSVYVTR